MATRITFLVGMRGVGKTSCLSLLDPTCYQCFDLDALFEVKHGPILTFVAQHGWSTFRGKELDLLQSFILERLNDAPHANHNDDRIIVCATGGGIIESSEAMHILRQHQVIFIQRFSHDYLSCQNPLKPAFGDDPITIYNRRFSLYHNVSTYDFFVDGPVSFASFMQLLHTCRPMSPNFPLHTLVLDCPEVNLSLDCLFGIDVIEYRYDLIVPANLYESLASTVHFGRKILFTLRSIEEKDHFVKTEACISTFSPIIDVYEDAARSGFVDFIDIELAKIHLFDGFLAKYGKEFSGIVLSCHQLHDCSLESLQDACVAMQKYQAKFPHLKFLPKLITRLPLSSELYDFIKSLPHTWICHSMHYHSEEAPNRTRMANFPKTSLIYLSRFDTDTMFSFESYYKLLFESRSKEIGKFYLIGDSPLLHRSLSPFIHRMIFRRFGFQKYTYDVLNGDDFEKIVQCIKDPEFRGASVTMPYKSTIMSTLNMKPEDRRTVNTIIRQAHTFEFYNTDMMAMSDFIERKNLSVVATDVVIYGASSSAESVLLSLQAVHCRIRSIWIFNRTVERAKLLYSKFKEIINPDLQPLVLLLIYTLPLSVSDIEGHWYPSCPTVPSPFYSQLQVVDFHYLDVVSVDSFFDKRPIVLNSLIDWDFSCCLIIILCDGLELLVRQAIHQAIKFLKYPRHMNLETLYNDLLMACKRKLVAVS